MKKIKLTVASILLSGMCFAQTSECCQKTAQEVQSKFPCLWMYSERVIIERVDHIEIINTIEDMIEWMNSDIDNLVIDQETGETYVNNLKDVLFRVKNRTILIENED